MHDDLERLHTALNYFCPTGVEQTKLTSLRNELTAESEADDQIVAAMLGYMLDGINFGNW